MRILRICIPMIAIIFCGVSKSTRKIALSERFSFGIFHRCTEPRNRRTETRKLTRKPREKEKAPRGKFAILWAFCRIFPRIFKSLLSEFEMREREEQNPVPNPVNVFFRKREADNARVVNSTGCHSRIFNRPGENIQLHINWIIYMSWKIKKYWIRTEYMCCDISVKNDESKSKGFDNRRTNKIRRVISVTRARIIVDNFPRDSRICEIGSWKMGTRAHAVLFTARKRSENHPRKHGTLY